MTCAVCKYADIGPQTWEFNNDPFATRYTIR